EIAAIAVGVEEAYGAGRPGLDGRAAGIAADAKAAEQRAVIAAILRENLRTAGDHARHDESLIVGLGAAVDEVALVQVAGRPLGQGVGQGDAFLGQEDRRHAADFLRLLLDRLDHAAVVMAQVAVEDLGQHVEVALALPIEEINAVAMIDLEETVFALL